MSVAVTGGAGYIGSHMVFERVEAGEQVVVLDGRCFAHHAFLDWEPRYDGFDTIVAQALAWERRLAGQPAI